MIFAAFLAGQAAAQPKPGDPAKPTEQRAQPAPQPGSSAASKPTLSLPPQAGPAIGASQPAAPAPARPAAAAAAPAAPATPAGQIVAWDGRWTGMFAARTDMTVTISGGQVVSVTLLGQPLAVTNSAVTPMSVSASGPEFRIDLARFTATAGQGIYANARQEKAIAAFSKN